MNVANLFVAIVFLLNAGASIAYGLQGRYNLAAYWLGATVIGGSLLWRGLH